jgi:hypothetical protein
MIRSPWCVFVWWPLLLRLRRVVRWIGDWPEGWR